MPKMKTHSGAKKRFKVTGSGKVRARLVDANDAFCALSRHDVVDVVGRGPDELGLWVDEDDAV